MGLLATRDQRLPELAADGLAAVQPQLRAKLAASANRRQGRNSKKFQPMHGKLRILTGARARPIRPAPSEGVVGVGSVIKKRRKKMRKHKKKKLLKRSRHKRK